MRFANRSDAGRQLARRLSTLAREDLVVLALPRGGVPVAFEVASELGVPLDVIVVRKLGVPLRPELAMGAIGEEDVLVVNEEVVRRTGVNASNFAAVVAREREELARRVERFRGSRTRVSLVGHTALIVDDGIATGSTALAACQVARAQGAERVFVAAPIGPPSAIDALRQGADEVITLETTESFRAIGEFYDNFSPTADDEIVRLLG